MSAAAADEPARIIARLPLGNAYWVEPCRLLAGEYPASASDDETRTRLEALLDAGIDAFLDLTAPGERRSYEELLPPGVLYRRHPLRDHGLPDSDAQMEQILADLQAWLSGGRRVYVHCRAGIGRTGMVVACHLVRGGRDGESALRELNRLWLGSPRSTTWPSVPETEEQANWVLDWARTARQGAPSVMAGGAAALRDEPPPLHPAALGPARRLRERFHGALLGLATGDALAAATQFRKPGSFAPIGDLLGGGPFDLPRGAWSDDTAMALCLAESLVERARFDAADQVQRYARWQQQGYLSATGQCVGISAAVARALAAAQWRRQPLAGSHDPQQLPPEPLTRVAPIAMFFFASLDTAVQQAAEQARTTAQAPDLLGACRFLAASVHAALAGRRRAEVLAPPREVWAPVRLSPRLERLARGEFLHLSAERLRPFGDGLDLLEAALWVLARTEGFREGALAAVNLGGHADVIGAIYGQLAGALLGVGAIPPPWRLSLARLALLEELADRLLAQAMVGLTELP
jgi:ADP-ribosylglycohydrolase